MKNIFRNPVTMAATVLLAPVFALAQEGGSIVESDLGEFILDIQAFINDLLIPLVFSLALIVFLYGVFRYFVLGSGNETAREEGRKYIVYAIIGFVVMISIWGIVTLLASVIPQSGPLVYPTF